MNDKKRKRNMMYNKDPEVSSHDEDVVLENVNEQLEPEKITSVLGTVTNCDRLNVRQSPNITSKVLTAVTKNTELLVEDINESGDFYKVITPMGIDGYCKKDYVKLQP